MTISNKIKALIALCGSNNRAIAAALGISPQSFSNKLNRCSFSAADLMVIASALNCELSFKTADGQKIYLND